MDYAQLADRHTTLATDASLDPAEATVNALAGIGYALLNLAEVVGRLEQ